MQQLNKVELRGIVGNVQVQEYQGRKVARVSVATDYIYENRDREKIVETTWHSVTVWDNKSGCSLDGLKRGDKVYVQGRLRTLKYNDASGVDRQAWEILANEFQKVG